MLSFIYQLAHEYEQEHGFRPNVLYLNRTHFAQLQGQLAEIHNLGTMSKLLGMEIVLEDDLTHPHVAWSTVDWQRAVAV
jgi:hypothetical protein